MIFLHVTFDENVLAGKRGDCFIFHIDAKRNSYKTGSAHGAFDNR